VRAEGFVKKQKKDSRNVYTFSFHPPLICGAQKQESSKEQCDIGPVKELPLGMLYRYRDFSLYFQYDASVFLQRFLFFDFHFISLYFGKTNESKGKKSIPNSTFTHS
jgi:hypothetical protein